MSGLRAYDRIPDPGSAALSPEPPRCAGMDERREVARAYRRWTAMLRGRLCPSIEDLEPSGVAGPREALFDLRRDPCDPDLVCVGGALIADCGRTGMKRLADVPSGSLLSLLAGHYRHAASSGSPIAFEGEEAASDGHSSTYRAILLPLSSDGHSVDFVYGTISWNEPAEQDLEEAIWAEVERSGPPAAATCQSPIWPRAAQEGRRELQSA